MDNSKEVFLKGGRTTQGVVRIENTVHRPFGENSAFTHSLLKLLAEKDFPYSPRFLGLDDKGREILTFIDGIVPHGEMELTAENLIQCVKALKTFHDITAGSELAGSSEVVCHNDFAPWNVVIKDGDLAGIIDFDDATSGERLDDLAYFIWTFMKLGSSDLSVELQGKSIKMVCDAYGLEDREGLVDAILRQQEKILIRRRMFSENEATQEARDFSRSKLPQIQAEINWVKKNRMALQNSF